MPATQRIVAALAVIGAAAVLLCAALVGSAGSAEPVAPEVTGPSRAVLDLVDRYCVDCHGPAVQKRGLRLDGEQIALGDPKVAQQWEHALDRLVRREMPPADGAQPPDDERRAAAESLHKTLHAASLKRQQSQGRADLRRLTRVEYEHTLRDLLSAPVDVKGLLPDDKQVAGFDKVSSAFDVSPEHLLRYQQAAEAALLSVVPKGRPAPMKDRRTGRQIGEKPSPFAQEVGKVARLEGDTLILYARTSRDLACATKIVPQRGRYRVRLSGYAVNTGGQPLPVRLIGRDQYPVIEGDNIIVRDVPADVATVVEGELELREKQMVAFSGWSLDANHEFAKRYAGTALETYDGPGLAVQWIEIEGPLLPADTGVWNRLYTPKGRDVKSGVAGLLRDFATRAFRQPLDERALRDYVALVMERQSKRVPIRDALALGYKAILSSPRFLFLYERPGKLDDHALAARLSYFLWSSLPDEELTTLATKGELARPEVLHAQVERMLDDPRVWRFVEDFVAQWLDLSKINDTSPDSRLYGEFDEFLFWSMPRETTLFFDEVLRHDRSLTEFVRSDWTYLNERLARHYGVPDVYGGELRKVELPTGCHRGGVLTHGSVLKVTADGTRTSPVLRGKWVLERIIGLPPRPPPPDIPAIEPDIRGTTTIRQQLDKHRNSPACASCHKLIDPPGFALESFDVIGGWRDFYRAPYSKQAVELVNYPDRKVFRGPAVELGGQTASGERFRDFDDYVSILLKDPDQLARNLAQKLLVYATGAEIQFADREVVEEIIARVRQKNYGFRTLVHEVVQSRVFLNK